MRKRLLPLLICSLAALLPAMIQAQEEPAAPVEAPSGPTPYPGDTDEAAWPGRGPMRSGSWMMGERKAFWAKRQKDQGAIVFAGDSLIGGYKVEKFFPTFKVANRGVGGEVTRGLLFRLKEDILDLNPQAIVICSGSNDLSCKSDPDLAVGNLEIAIDQIRKFNEKTPIILCLVTPRDAPNAPINEGALEQLNKGIKKLESDVKNVHVVDVFKPLADSDGKPLPELFGADKIHILPAGYEKWTELLKPLFEKLELK